MKKRLLVVALALALVLVVSVSAMAAQGRWKTWASDSLGQLSDTDSQSAYVTTAIAGVETKVTGLEWTRLSGDSKARDYSSTTTDGTKKVWNINDTSTTMYQKTAITPVTFDNSRGIVMAKIKVNSSLAVNGTFGFSTDTGYGLQLALRSSGQIRVRTGEGANAAADPSDIVTTQYRVYALAWSGTTANVWYSNGTDWSGVYTDWTKIASGYTMLGGTATMDGASAVKGMVLYDCGSTNTWNGNIEWMAHTTYEGWDPTISDWDMNPWSFNPNPVVPEPASLLALMTGLVGIVGFARRRR